MAEKPPERVENVPDPDEDDLDDLDDVLDQFSTTSIAQPTPASASTTAPSASGPGRPSTDKPPSYHSTDPRPDAKSAAPASKDAPSEEDFAKQLQAGMSNLISELDSNPEMQAEFEKMMQELIAAGAAPTDQAAGEHLKQAAQAAPKAPSESTKPGGSSSSKAGQEAAFQDTITRTMERMKASDTAASTSTASAGAQSEDDMLAAMMRELTEGGGAGGEEGFNTMLMNMMAHLTNKEILYDPMKELHDKFPEWLEKNGDKCDKDDLRRYKEQQRLVGEIVGRFERKGYSDDNEDDREYIVERMQKMQAEGQPPSDLVGDMSAAQEALGDIDQGCPTQ